VSLFSGARRWVYPRTVQGRFQTLHRWTGRALIGALFVGPWLSWGGHPLLRIDLPARRLHLAGQIFTAADGYLMVLGALLAAFSLFFASALFGRLWCGYVCPQTVFLEEWVRRIEAWVEGDAAARLRRDRGPWTADRLARKAAKVGLLTVLAAALSLTVLAYFSGAVPTFTGQAGSATYTLAAVIAGAALADWLWFREQLCIYLCPYARFQSALTDEHSLTVGFAPGVPIRKGREAALAGDCIDCRKCVAACPMGIDIREGFQLECINCARCVDACESVMPALGFDSHVRYTTIARDEGRPTRPVRPRTVAYGALVTGLAAALLASLTLHDPVEVSLHRSPGTLYQVDADGFVRNTYLLRVVNNDAHSEHTFAVVVDDLPGAHVQIPELQLASGEDRTVPLVVRVPLDQARSTLPLRITVRADGRHRVVDTTFKGPVQEPNG
jgi:cytochrome c oxidase accessory protein FixG